MKSKNNKNPQTNFIWFSGAELVPIKELHAMAKLTSVDLDNAVSEWDKFAPEEYKGLLNAK